VLFLREVVGIAMSLIVTCGAAAQSDYPHFLMGPTTLGGHVRGVVQAGKGAACYRDGQIGPPTYAVSQIGTKGCSGPKTTGFGKTENDRCAHTFNHVAFCVSARRAIIHGVFSNVGGNVRPDASTVY
jgi:hypothetical protein